MTRTGYFDAARAVAALSVVAVHAQQFFTPAHRTIEILAAMGQLGVQLFFVISAFLIFESLDRLRQKNGSLFEFFVHRFLRIAPLYYFVIFANMVVWVYVAPNIGWLDSPDDSYTPFNIVTNMLFLHGLVPSANQFVGGGWSVGTEFLFYFLAPAMFMLRRRPLWLIVIGVACFPLIYFAIPILQPLLGEPDYVNNNGFLYYSILNQMPVFICGALLFCWRDRIFELSLPVVIFGCLAPLGAAYCLWTEYFTGKLTFAYVPLLAGVSSVFLIVLLSKINRFGWLIQQAGKQSFSMYMWNFAALSLVSWTGQVSGFGVSFSLGFPAAAAISFLLSGITYYAIERPFINLAKRMRSSAAPAIA
jgi:peptidoglycan/LPS O-acetylase OafA/YrhL